MFKSSLSDSKLSLTEDDFSNLAELSAGLSGADISVAARDAMMEPIRKIRDATHFRRTEEGGLTPCSSGSPDAMEMSFMEIEKPEELLEPETSLRDVLVSLERTKPSVGEEEIRKTLKFKEDYGPHE